MNRLTTYFLLFLYILLFNFNSLLQAEPVQPNSPEPITSPRCNTFTFDSSASRNPDNKSLTYLWDFGDGEKSSEPIADHTFQKSGDYEVTLSITDNTDSECSTAVSSQLIRANIPPTASFTMTDKACINEAVSLDASESASTNNRKLSFNWNFGDGTKDNKGMTTKTYGKGGVYKVSLTVDDESKTTCSTQIVEKNIFINEPPVAEAGPAEILKCINTDEDLTVNFDASQSTDMNNDSLTYTWDFGDGEQGSGAQVTHPYSKLGNYDVKLFVKDEHNLGCGSSLDFVTVRINKAPKADAGEDIVVCPNEEVNFDGSNSFTNKKGTTTATWFFGDGSSTEGLKVSHQYAQAGKYQAHIDIEDNLNKMCPSSRDTKEVVVNSVPTVTIKSVSSACSGNEVEFDASSANDADGDELEYYWSFGDGTILRRGSRVTHSYKQGGEYRVSVIVDDKKGTSCSTATANTTIDINTAPIADLGSNHVCCVDIPAEFNASSSSDADGDDLFYFWDFGDGTTSSEVILDHMYTKSGTYNVTLTVDDGSHSSCSKSTASFTANVHTSPVPVITVR